jgi:hypothetical protein
MTANARKFELAGKWVRGCGGAAEFIAAAAASAAADPATAAEVPHLETTRE